MQTLPQTNARWAAIAAALGVAIIGIGETMMHWTGNIGSSEPGANPYQFLMGIPEWRLTIGHFLAVVAAPIYFLGYWQVSHRLFPNQSRGRFWFFGGAVYVLTMAGIWIGSRAFLAQTLQLVGDGPLAMEVVKSYELLLESLIWFLRIGMLAISAAFVVTILKGGSNYPKWMAALNPFTLLIMVFLTMLVPAIGAHLVPAALNVAHVPFFLLSAFAKDSNA